MWVLLLGGIGVAAGLDSWAGHEWPVMTVLAIFGSFISYVSTRVVFFAPRTSNRRLWLSGLCLFTVFLPCLLLGTQ